MFIKRSPRSRAARATDQNRMTLLISSLIFSSAFAFYDGTSVVELSGSTFDQIYDDTSVWMLEFYAPWCGHCKNLAPQFVKAAENLDGLVKFGAINCDNEQQLCGQFGIKGFPTLKVAPWDKKKGKLTSQITDYQGERSAAAIAKFMLGSLPNHVVKLTDKNSEKFFGSALKKVILFSDKATTDLYKSMAMQYKNRLEFAQAPMKSKFAEQFEVTESPTLLVVDGGADATKEQASVFDGALKPRTIAKFLDKHAPPLKKSSASGGKKADKAKAKPAEGEEASEPAAADEPKRAAPQDDVWRVASRADYEQHCVERAGSCVIGIFDPQADFFDEYQKVMAEVLDKQKNGAFTIVWLDGTEQSGFLKKLGLYGSDLPRLAVVNSNKRVAGAYIGAFDAEHINEYLLKVKLGGAVIKRLANDVDLAASIVDEKGASAGSKAKSEL